MPLPPSGPISMGDINVELAFPATQVISLNDTAVRALAQVPAGVISLQNFYGKSNITPKGYAMGGDSLPLAALTGSISAFNFSNETTEVIGATTPNGRALLSLGNLTDRNVSLVLATPTVPASVQRFSFSSQTFSAGASIAPSPTGYAVGQRMQSLDGNAYGTAGFSGTPAFSYVSKFSLLNETLISTPFAVLAPNNSNNVYNQVNFSAAKNYSKGLSGAGNNPPSSPIPQVNNRLFRVTYPTDTAALVGTTFTFAQSPGCPAHNAENGFVYTGLGPTPEGWPTSMSRIVFSNETSNRLFQNIGFARIRSGAWQTPTNAYFFCGNNNAVPNALLSEIRRYTFSNGALTLLGASIPARNFPNAGSSSNHAQSAPVFG